MDEVLRFDRSVDVSKLEGCNTRGVEYRWQIFLDEIAGIPRGNNVLDFGAGSLRESFDLFSRGYNVTSIDIDSELLSFYKSRYAWPDNGSVHSLIATGDLLGGLAQIGDKQFALVTCFDVLEHLEDPESMLRIIKRHMIGGGKIFITVPNGRTLFELAFRLDLLIARATGRYMRPGEPHLQRNSPRKWQRIITQAGLIVRKHDLQIGFFANTLAALVQLPLTLGGRMLRKLGITVDAAGLSERICSGRLMAMMDNLDHRTKSFLGGLYGWNLLVAEAPKA